MVCSQVGTVVHRHRIRVRLLLADYRLRMVHIPAGGQLVFAKETCMIVTYLVDVFVQTMYSTSSVYGL